MANIKQERATANLRMLEFVARKLGPLNEEVIYLGGCTTALFITDPLSLDVRPQRIIVLTHIPPFKEACLHEAKISNDDWLPYFASKASGDVLMNICTMHPDINFLVLCGHTHGKATYCPIPNLIVEAGLAEYNKPEIQKVITTESW